MTPTEQKAFDATVKALELAMDNLRSHGDNCFLHDEGEYNACFCGKDSLVDHLQSVVESATLTAANAVSAAPQVQAKVSWNLKYADSTPKLNVGNSAFEDWFQQQPFATQIGVKQMCRDAYAAGMGDPLVTYAHPQATEPAANWATYPEKCPITRRDFFMVIEHPELGMAPTYGGPYDSYTIPHMGGKPDQQMHDRELMCHRFDHDLGYWVDDEIIPLRVIHDDFLPEDDSSKASEPVVKDSLTVPAGYKLVPVEPTREMLVALVCTGLRNTFYEEGRARFMEEMAQGYSAMLAAAPEAKQ